MVAKGHKHSPIGFSSAACAGVLFFTLCATAFAQGPKPEQKKEPLPPNVKCVKVVTRLRDGPNRTVTVWFRIPKGYDASRRESNRVLVLFGGRNTDGVEDAKGRLGWGEWADKEGVFIVCPGFKDDNYWEPEAWSGKALTDALEEIRTRYNVCTEKLLFYGYSAGSQCSNLFPSWRPKLARAWVSHACGVFHEPSAKMAGVPGLVTCGDADAARYVISRDFVAKCREKGVSVLWRSFPNHPHDVPPDSLKLARAFLSHYHNLYRSDLAGAQWMQVEPATKTLPPFVGDDQEGVFYPSDDRRAKHIPAEDRVALPSKEVALAWGAARTP